MSAAGSLASATSSRVDSASKHIQACKVNTEFLESTLEGVVAHPAAELQSNKMKYCMHKDEVVVGLGRPRYGASIINTRKKAYPSVITNLGRMNKHSLRWMALHNFITEDALGSKDLKDRLFDIIKKETADTPTPTKYTDDLASLKDKGTAKIFKEQVSNMMDLYFVGISLGTAFAHSNSGDTVASVMIGGLRTVLNGHFPVHTNDLIMFYFAEEIGLFKSDGSRHSKAAFRTPAGHFNLKPCIEFLEKGEDALPGILHNGGGDGDLLSAKEKMRKNYYDRANGNFGGKQENKLNIFYIKPCIASSEVDMATLQPQYFPCDRARIVGRAISNAQPFEMVDIQLSRQAI